MKTERNNFAAGAFVLAGIALALAVVALLADWNRLFTPMQSVSVRFTLSDGVKGLQVGAPVDIGGSTRGTVIDIRDAVEDQVVIAQIVEFVIPADYTVYENARIELQEPLIGGGTRLNIRSFGGEQAGATANGEGSAYEHGIDPPIAGGMAGNEAVAAAVRELGIEDLQRRQIQNIIANLDQLVAAVGSDPAPVAEIIANLQQATGTLADDLPEIAANLRSSTGDLQHVTADVRERYGTWLEGIDTLLASAMDGVERIDGALAMVNGMLDENREPLAEAVQRAAATMANAEQITDQVRDQTLTQITAMLDEAKVAVENIRVVTEDTQGFMAAQRPVLERTIANARIVSDQLKLTAVEVRRAPWRLLYEPTDEELNTDNVYDAARSFALAASTLNATADSLQAIVDRRGTLDQDDANVQLILENLQRVFEKFDDAENKFWEALDEMPSK
ncbi:MAG: hypothetical protein WD294_03690 [Phycisphaeraceae bacterium]